MGLDITAYSNVSWINSDDLPEDEEERDALWDSYNFLIAFAYPDFVESTRGLYNHDVVTYNIISGGEIAFGVYDRSMSNTHRFRAGSYSGYGQWRDLLTEFAEDHFGPDDTDEPFIELTYFADNEGCIGPEAAADLLADFHKYRYEIPLWFNPSSAEVDTQWFMQKYEDWTRAFELAADGGLVDFH